MSGSVCCFSAENDRIRVQMTICFVHVADENVNDCRKGCCWFFRFGVKKILAAAFCVFIID